MDTHTSTTSISPSIGFDVDAWLQDAQPPTRSVVVFGRGDLVAELEDLVARRDQDQPEQQQPQVVVDHRLAGPAAAAQDIDALAAQIAAVRSALKASRLTVHVRAVLNSERDAVRDEHTSKDPDTGAEKLDMPGYEHTLLAHAMVAPTMTAAQVRAFHAKIGEGQWAALVDAFERASGETIDVPLSRLG